MTNDEIVDYCKEVNPRVIYLSIGCSQAEYPVGDRRGSPQGYPPVIAALGGRQICILVDPYLENPPRCSSLTSPTSHTMIHEQMGQVTFITLRRNFDWAGADRSFVNDLCAHVIAQNTRLIAQDYSGSFIHNYYPLSIFGPPLLRCVLFDFTYMDGGCFVDLDKVRILMREDGSFVQPHFEPIHQILPYCSHDQRTFIVKDRHEILYCLVKRLHKIQSGAEEPRDWCTAEYVFNKMKQLCAVYKTNHSTMQEDLEALMVEYMIDLCVAVGSEVDLAYIRTLVLLPGKEYEEIVGVLKTLLLSN